MLGIPHAWNLDPCLVEDTSVLVLVHCCFLNTASYIRLFSTRSHKCISDGKIKGRGEERQTWEWGMGGISWRWDKLKLSLFWEGFIAQLASAYMELCKYWIAPAHCGCKNVKGKEERKRKRRLKGRQKSYSILQSHSGLFWLLQSVTVFAPIQPTYYCLQEEKELQLFTQKKQEEGIILGSIEIAASRNLCLFFPPAASHL